MIGCNEIDNYIKNVRNGTIIASNRVKLLCDLVERAFANEKLRFDNELFKNYLKIGNLMYPIIYEWEKFVVACLLCTFKADGNPRWHWALCEIARGAGKDGLIAWISTCLVSKFNKVAKYDVDICANNEEQAIRPMLDVVEFLEKPEYYEMNKKSFHWNKEQVKGLTNKGRIRGHTNSPKGKDGLRTGCLIMNEVHQYENYDQIKVFTTGLGKIPCPRRISFTTNGEVREGVLDDYLKQADLVLNGEEEDNGHFYFICCLDSKEEVHNEQNWLKANPSLAYNQSLLQETREEYKEWLKDPYKNSSFMTKRMNLPEKANEKQVVDYELIKDTNQPLIDLQRKPCIVGIDLSRTTDFASVSLLFRVKDKRYVINHNWVCTHSSDWEEMKIKDQFPKWVEQGLLTIVDDIEINPQLIADYIQHQKSKYNILKVCMDDFRQSIMARDLGMIGFSKDQKNLKLVRPSDICKVVPVIESIFINNNYVWGDNPILRWCCNNTKIVPFRTRNTENSDLGNQIYAKIEPHSRKTDAFMSLVAAQTCESEIPEQKAINMTLLKPRTM